MPENKNMNLNLIERQLFTYHVDILYNTMQYNAIQYAHCVSLKGVFRLNLQLQLTVKFITSDL